MDNPPEVTPRKIRNTVPTSCERQSGLKKSVEEPVAILVLLALMQVVCEAFINQRQGERDERVCYQ